MDTEGANNPFHLFLEGKMIIEINWTNIHHRSEVREAVAAAFDLLGEKETGGIFRDDYSLVCKDNPGQLILEVSDENDELTKCLVWQEARKSGGQDECWHEVEY